MSVWDWMFKPKTDHAQAPADDQQDTVIGMLLYCEAVGNPAPTEKEKTDGTDSTEA